MTFSGYFFVTFLLAIYFYRMKKILFVFIALLALTQAQGQTNPYPSPIAMPAPNVFRAQMLNVSNTIPNAVLDTATDATALYLTLAKRTSTGLATAYPLYRSGSLSITVTGVKISGTPAGSITVEQSYDGSVWAPIHYATAVPLSSLTSTSVTTTYTSSDVFTITNVATVQANSWDFPKKYAPYLRVKIAGTGTQTSSWRAFFTFLQD